MSRSELLRAPSSEMGNMPSSELLCELVSEMGNTLSSELNPVPNSGLDKLSVSETELVLTSVL